MSRHVMRAEDEDSQHAELQRQSIVESLIGMGFPIDWALRAVVSFIVCVCVCECACTCNLLNLSRYLDVCYQVFLLFQLAYNVALHSILLYHQKSLNSFSTQAIVSFFSFFFFLLRLRFYFMFLHVFFP